jgi:hypothetical protein
MTKANKKALNDISLRILMSTKLIDSYTAKIISNHHNTQACVFRLSSIKGEEKILKIEINNVPKLKNEVEFILNNINPKIYPDIFFHGLIEQDIYYCIMESLLLDFKSFSRLYNLNQLRKDHIVIILKLLENIFSESKNDDIEKIYSEHYTNRLSNRINNIKSLYLQNLLKFKYIYINGKEYPNLLSALDSIGSASNTPFFTCGSSYPGDLHFDHIFINSLGAIKVIDPKGTPCLPLEYDLGKLLHSLHGDYNILHSLNFTLSSIHTNEFMFDCCTPYNKYKLLQLFEKEVISIWGDRTLRYAYLSEIFHFASMLAHHEADRQETLGIYCRTLQLIDNYYEKYIK